MASLIQEKDGRYRVQFYDGNGSRRSVGLGSISDRNASRLFDKLEQLIEHRLTGTPLDPDVSRWVSGLDDRMHLKLVKAGLTEPRPSAALEAVAKPVTITLGMFLDQYLEKRTDVKPGTQTFYRHTQRNLIAFFGRDKPLADITEGDADDFRRYLLRELDSEATVNRRCGLTKTFFRSAVRHRFVPSNPFQDLKTTSKVNEKRQRFIDRDTIRRIMDTAPDAEWRLIIALARYAGLRIPSEALSLRWSDIDWNQSRIHVTAPKTEHHEGRGTREIPIFPELIEPLRDAWDQAEAGCEFVITKHRPGCVVDGSGHWRGANLRTQFEKIIRRSGCEPWPKLFQNLRSTRETELAEDYPLHVVCAWIGNTERIAAKHYLQVTEDHFSKAATAPLAAPVRKPVRYGLEPHRSDSQAENAEFCNSLPCKEKRPHANVCGRPLWAIQDSNL